MKQIGKVERIYLLNIVTAVSVIILSVFAVTQYLPLLAFPLIMFFFFSLLFNWKNAFWILLFVLPISVHTVFQGGLLSLTLPAEPMMWMLLLAGFFWIVEKERLNWNVLLNPLVIVILLQFLWLIPSVIYSEKIILSFKFLLAKSWVIFCFFLLPMYVFRSKKDFKKAFVILFIPVLISVVIILCRHAYMGFLFSEMNRAVDIIYYNHVEYATLISMFFPILIVSFALAKKSAAWVRILIIFCILIFLAGIYFSFARAAMLAVLFAFLIASAIRYRFAKFIMPAIYAIIIFGFCFLVYNSNYTKLRPHFERTYYHKTFSSHLLATFKGRDLSSMERLYRWIAAVRMSNDRPLTGFGPNAFYYHYKPYTLNSFRTYSSNNEEKSTTHNYFLYILTEQGFPGMILYAVLIALIFSRAQKIYHSSEDSFDRACVMAITMMLAACFINNCFSELLETPKIGPLFYLGISLLVILDVKSMQQKSAVVKQPKF